jgi:DNA-binding response OmpR family regulator
MSATVLVVDDQRNIRNLLRMYLEQEGFTVEEAADGDAALARLSGAPPPDFLILDLMLPGIDGWEICRRIRADKGQDLPILMLTARDDDVDKIIGLELGADDYVTKPFNPREVVARVKAILRRTTRDRPTTSDVLKVGNLEIDPQRREVRVKGAVVDMRRKEFDLLHAMAQQPEIVLSRAQLLDQVWGYDFYGETRTVDVHIAALRKRLVESDVEIETVIGVGYRLLPPPRG